MSRWARALAAAALLLTAAACGSILPKPAQPPLLFRLTPLAPATAARPLPLQLVVDLPTAPAGIDTARIVLSRSATSIDYFADAAWTDRAPVMLQQLIVESLENAGQIRLVAAQSPELRADAVLMVDLRAFEADYEGNEPPELQFRIDCQLIKMPERSPIAVQSFAGHARAGANETAAIVVGFDDAFHAAMAPMAAWTAASLAPLVR
jgi:cholesterol transport system auxiliary component